MIEIFITVQFYMIQALNGVSISILVNGTYSRFVDVVDPDMATLFYMVECGFDGISSLLTSLLAGMHFSS